MFHLPTVIASSVIRSAHQGESHGGVYLVDLELGSCRQVIDWDEEDIVWEGRGGDRGLRGIAFYGDQVYLAASDEIFVYSADFQLIETFRNRYLKHCHEIFVGGDALYLTSTGVDSILVFDLQARVFAKGYCVRHGKPVALARAYSARLGRTLGRILNPRLRVFDPNAPGGPQSADTTHLNSVHAEGDAIYLAGTRLAAVFALRDGSLGRYTPIPYRTHNAHPYRDGVLLNHTAGDQIAYLDRRGRLIESFPIKHYTEQELAMSHLPQDHARQGFGRGLATRGDLIVGGSSPATVSAYRFGQPEAIKTVTISLDVRNAIHGLEIWPF